MPRKIKLSTAILRGSKLKPKCINYMFDGKGTCALGAAHHYLFKELPPSRAWNSFKLSKKYPELSETIEGMDGDNNLYEHIITRNDIKRWSRQRIARWLRKLGY